MPKDHFWSKRSSKKESTLDGTKTNGLTGNVEITRESGSRSSQKVGKTTSSGGLKQLFGWGHIRKKSTGGDVPRSVSSSALSEMRTTIGFKRTASNGEVEHPSRMNVVDCLRPIDPRQRHSSERSLQAKNSCQIYSLPVDTIKKVNGDHNIVENQSPVNSHVPKRPQKDYTEPWSLTIRDGVKTQSPSNHHIKAGSSKKKENVSSNSVSPPPISPETVNNDINNDVNNDDYEEPWDKYTGAMPPFRIKSKEKSAPKLPPKPPPPPIVAITKPLPPLPDDDDDDDDDDDSVIVDECNSNVPAVLPKRSISLKVASVSDYSLPVDTKRMSDTALPVIKPVDQCLSYGESSSEEPGMTPSPPPLPVRYVPTPLVNVSIPLEEQPWYHHKLSRSEAEDILRDKANFSFLVRQSESSRDPYSLSIRNTAAGFMHLKIAYKNGMYVIGQFSKPFINVPEAIGFYTNNKLTLKGAEHKQLKHPIHAIK